MTSKDRALQAIRRTKNDLIKFKSSKFWPWDKLFIRGQIEGLEMAVDVLERSELFDSLESYEIMQENKQTARSRASGSFSATPAPARSRK